MWQFHKSAQGEPKSASGTVPNKKRRADGWLWTEGLLLVSGLVLLAIYGVARIESIVGSRAALNKFAAIESSVGATVKDAGQNRGSFQKTDLPETADPATVNFSLWDAQRVHAYKDSAPRQPGAPLAVLHIPKIHLNVPLLEGTDNLTLNHAVGRIAGTARPGEPGNIGIAGHRDGFFRGLKDVRVGDAIELRTLGGTNGYIVDHIQVVMPDDVSVLQTRSSPSLTLVTCYPFYFIGSAPQRYIITASLTRGIKSAPDNPIPARDQKQTAQKGETQ